MYQQPSRAALLAARLAEPANEILEKKGTSGALSWAGRVRFLQARHFLFAVNSANWTVSYDQEHLVARLNVRANETDIQEFSHLRNVPKH